MEQFAETLRAVDDLRALYRAPTDLVARKKVPHLDGLARSFVEGSPFCLLATADADGNCDVSPRGGPPGFVRVLDRDRLAVPDLPGNNLLDSLTNILVNPHVGMLFVVPGRDETLRVEGEACLTTDPQVLDLWRGETRTPTVAIGVGIVSVYVHCAKAFRRGRVWDPTSWDELVAPDTCDIAVEQLGLDTGGADLRAAVEEGYARELADERGAPRHHPDRRAAGSG